MGWKVVANDTSGRVMKCEEQKLLFSAGPSYSSNSPYLQYAWLNIFEDILQEDGLYCFPLTLNNLDESTVNETEEKKMPYNEARLEIILVHKPRL